jgi:glycerol kinase
MSIAFLVAEIIEYTAEDTGSKPEFLKVDGGMASNRFLMQFQSDLLGLPLMVSETKELTSFGIANFSSSSLRRQRLPAKISYFEYKPRDKNHRVSIKLWRKWRDILSRELLSADRDER